MSINDSSKKTEIKKWFAFDKPGLIILIVAALVTFAFGFFDPEMMAGGPENDTTIEETADLDAASETAPASSGKAAKSKAQLDDDGADADGEVLAAGQTGRQQTRAQRSNRRPVNIVTFYLGEEDWDFIGLITLRFVLNMIFAYILICLVFGREHRIKEYTFSYFVSNILIFMVTSMLASVRVRQGFAFGLFAILSILRFRTEQLQVREMTFLFAALILGVLNSLATDGLSIFAILWANIILCLFIYIIDGHFIGNTDMINLVYDNTSLLSKDKKKELFEDIKKRFGYDVVKVSIVEMNYLTDSAKVKLVYRLDPETKKVAA